MEYPISEILDRYSIALLKKERLQIDNDQELNDLSMEIDNYRKTNTVVDEYIIKLKEINGKIWDLEFDIRKGKEGELKDIPDELLINMMSDRTTKKIVNKKKVSMLI